MKGSVSMLKVFGIKVAVHWTFAILMGWVMFSGKTAAESWWSIVLVFGIFLCVTLHELGHALTARYFGIRTIEITLLPIGGLAQIERMPDRAYQELIIALAGPLVNLAIAGILFLPVRGELDNGMHSALAAVNADNFFLNLFVANLSLALFNLVPAFPMDGGRIFRAILSFRLSKVQATKVAVYTAQGLALLFIFIGVSSNQYVQASPTLLLISLFVFFGAQAELQSVSFRSVLGGHHVSEVAMKNFGVVGVRDELKKACALMLDSSYHDFVVMDESNVVGTLSRGDLLKALNQKGENSLVGDCMNVNLTVTQANVSLERGYDMIQRSESKLLLVKEDEKLLGIVDPENILEFVMTRQAMAK